MAYQTCMISHLADSEALHFMLTMDNWTCKVRRLWRHLQQGKLVLLGVAISMGLRRQRLQLLLDGHGDLCCHRYRQSVLVLLRLRVVGAARQVHCHCWRRGGHSLRRALPLGHCGHERNAL